MLVRRRVRQIALRILREVASSSPKAARRPKARRQAPQPQPKALPAAEAAGQWRGCAVLVGDDSHLPRPYAFQPLRRELSDLPLPYNPPSTPWSRKATQATWRRHTARFQHIEQRRSAAARSVGVPSSAAALSKLGQLQAASAVLHCSSAHSLAGANPGTKGGGGAAAAAAGGFTVGGARRRGQPAGQQSASASIPAAASNRSTPSCSSCYSATPTTTPPQMRSPPRFTIRGSSSASSLVSYPSSAHMKLRKRVGGGVGGDGSNSMEYRPAPTLHQRVPSMRTPMYHMGQPGLSHTLKGQVGAVASVTPRPETRPRVLYCV